MRSRWIELAYYDEDLQPLNSTLRDEAVYIVRYGIYISSLDGKININPDFDVIPYDSGLSPTTQSQEYNNYQQYLDQYAFYLLSIAGSRLIKSTRTEIVGNNPAQDIYGTDPVDPIPPLHHWGRTKDYLLTGGNYHSQNNIRAQIAKAFQGKGMQWGGNDDGDQWHYFRDTDKNLVRDTYDIVRHPNARLNLLVSGKSHTPAQIRSLNNRLYDDHDNFDHGWGGVMTTQEYWTTHNRGIRPDDIIPRFKDTTAETYNFHGP
ncbi:MAG: hypothetical protein HRU15_15350, partial [Planctomycetes bacterium]|nr:hypothetical protein [Planctomycetota bacterium]